MKTWLLLLGCLLALTSQAQTRREVYAWKDAQGVTHYSDYPQPGARKILLNGAPSTMTAAPPAATPAEGRPAGARPAAQTGATEVVYDRLEIWSPENGANFFEPDSVINIRLRAEPALGPTDRLLTYLDGKLLPGDNLIEHSLSNVERGVHSVTSVIVNRDGKELIRSAPLVFHMKQPTANNPRNVGPTLKPQPTPLPAPRPATPKGG